MKYLLLGGLLLIAVNSLSQSKKKQIEILQHRLDSVTKANLVLEETLDEQVSTMSKSLDKLTKENEVLRSIMKGYIYDIDALNTKVMSLELENDSLRDKIAPSETRASKTRRTTSSNSQSPQIESGISYGIEPAPAQEVADPFPFERSGQGAGSGRFNREMGSGNRSAKNMKPERVRLSELNVDHMEIKSSAKISYWLWVNSDGKVMRFECIRSRTTTTDEKLIKNIGGEILKQIQYNQISGSMRDRVLFNVVLKVDE